MREKQIEEMAKVMCGGCYDGKECMHGLCADWYKAEKLYNANYRKLTEDSVVLSKEEYDTLKAENDKYVKDCIDYLATINKLENKVWEVEQQSSKETAEKILKWLKEHTFDGSFAIVETYFKEQFGVEIGGEK